MEEPRIDPQLHRDRQIALRPFLVAGVPILVLLLAVVFSFLQGFTALGKASSNSLYDPSSEVDKDEGFVGKANLLLRELVADVDNSVDATCLDSLNKHYPALEFALPYAEAHKPYIEASDLRLVAIHPERIKNESLREFFFNSRLPQLLQRQGEQLDETYFRIRCRGVDTKVNHIRPIEVRTIELLPSMFKVALAKNPWTGIITGAPNCLFNDSDAVFLTYGNSVLPIHNEQRHALDHPLQFHAVMGEGSLKGTRGDIDYYDYYLRTFKGDEVHSINIDLREQENTRGYADFMLSFSHDTLLISHSTDIMIIGEGKARFYKKPETGSQRPSFIPFVDGMKLLVYDDDERKLGEFVIQRQDPSRMLSCLVQSNMGKSRFFIDPSQTDLFTQQMLRGLSRHLSNRDNIDRVDLSIDPLLSKQFELEVKNYLHHLQNTIHSPSRQTKEQYDMSVTIMDIATGQVLATPFYTSLFDFDDYPEAMKMTVRNTSLSRRSVGSTFKPLVALPAVLSNPNLLEMNTASPRRYQWNGTSSDVDFFGRRTKVWAKKSSSHWGGCDFTTFLSRSDDVYPVALAALAMTNERLDASVTTLPVDGSNNFFTLSDNRNRYLMFRRAEDTQTINQRNRFFTDWLSYLYNTSYDKDYVNDLNLFKGLFVNDSLDLDQKHFGLDEITPEYTDLRLDRFYDGDDFHDRLVPWTLGQGDNMWNCIKVAEAWCRMVSKRQVSASFIKQRGDSLPSLIQSGPNYPGSVFGERSVNNINNTWNAFLSKLHDAQQNQNYSLLPPMRNRVVELNQRENIQLTLFSKTGTPDPYIRYEFPMLGGNNRFVDIGMFSFALMDNDQYQNNVVRNQPAKGIVCVVRITRSYQCNHCGSGKQCSVCEGFNGLQSKHARNFFSESSTRLQKLYDMTKNYY